MKSSFLFLYNILNINENFLIKVFILNAKVTWLVSVAWVQPSGTQENDAALNPRVSLRRTRATS